MIEEKHGFFIKKYKVLFEHPRTVCNKGMETLQYLDNRFFTFCKEKFKIMALFCS